ncbi:hypothetical protein [Streptomyces sp. NPDC085596]|uniref:hypothetical protein n=1 Tax=Streptomyces sp. NPDC085596 TaxID=3365731 RepID=UPI0037D2DD2B
MIENIRGRSTETKYGRIPLWLYESRAGLQAISTYGWLHGRYGHYERVMPSYATLAKELGVSRGSVIAYVKELTAVGAVRIETSGAAGRQTNRYVIAFNEPFPVTGQNTDQEGGQNADPVVSGVHPPGQPADGGGQPVVQKEDVSTKTFLEDKELSLPAALPAPRVAPESEREREIHVSIDLTHADETDATARVAVAWVEAYKRISGSSPASKAVSRVQASAASRLRADRSVDDLVLIAVDMAETNLSWTDLTEHEAHWLNKQQQGGLVGTDANVAGWLALAGDSKPVQGLGGHQPYRDDLWHRLEQQAAAGERPDGWEWVPHCGRPDCDEITRMYGHGDTQTYCGRCHPNFVFLPQGLGR